MHIKRGMLILLSRLIIVVVVEHFLEIMNSSYEVSPAPGTTLILNINIYLFVENGMWYVRYISDQPESFPCSLHR